MVTNILFSIANSTFSDFRKIGNLQFIDVAQLQVLVLHGILNIKDCYKFLLPIEYSQVYMKKILHIFKYSIETDTENHSHYKAFFQSTWKQQTNEL